MGLSIVEVFDMMVRGQVPQTEAELNGQEGLKPVLFAEECVGELRFASFVMYGPMRQLVVVA